MRWLLVGLIALLAVLQYRLWLAEGSLAEQHRLEQQVKEQARINAELAARNQALAREVRELKSGHLSVEQRAREELGLIREDEIFYHVVDKADNKSGGEQSDGEVE